MHFVTIQQAVVYMAVLPVNGCPQGLFFGLLRFSLFMPVTILKTDITSDNE